MVADGRDDGDGPPFESATDHQVAAALVALSAIVGISVEVWATLLLADRLAVLQRVEDRMAAIQARPSLRVVAETGMEAGEFGALDGERILINRDQLESDMPVSEFVDSVVHEGRHAYQYHVITNADAEIDSEVRATWAENFDS